MIWVDFMKLGAVTNKDLNERMDILKKAMQSMPQRSVAVIIGPQVTSERRSGLRSELRC